MPIRIPVLYVSKDERNIQEIETKSRKNCSVWFKEFVLECAPLVHEADVCFLIALEILKGLPK